MALEAPRVGLDLVGVARVRRALEGEGKEERWRRRVFTAREWRLAQASADRDAALAVCFAAKEAAFKTLGTGWGQGVAWHDVEVRNLAHDAAGLRLTGRAAELANDAGIALTVSHAHTGDLAVALVVGQSAA